MEFLLASGADVNAVNRFGESALIAAASCGEDAAVETLVSSGADMNACATAGENSGRTALIVARACLHVNTAKLLESYDPVHRARKESQEKRRKEGEVARKEAEERSKGEAEAARVQREKESLDKSAAAKRAIEEVESVRGE